MKKQILTERTAHFHLQFPDKPIKAILYVIHGYGQLAKDFLKEFEFLKSSNALIVSPEALSKFYNKNGDAVANWMTSHERESEIRDYLFYLNRLQEKIREDFGNLKTGILGYSQGASTAFRWAANLKQQADVFYACSGTIPPEIEAKEVKQWKSQLYFYYGNNDRLFKIEKAKQQMEKLKELKIPYQSFEFAGKHEIPKICLEHLRQFSEDD